jgi:hypothetical protein
VTDPRLVHLADQLGAALHALPPMLRQYYDALIRAGFEPAEALHLVTDLQRVVLDVDAVGDM